MTTFPAITTLLDKDPINIGVLAYMRERHRGHVYDLVLGEFESSAITKAALARRLGRAPEVISRWLGAPGNWTLDTVSDLLFAICGGEPYYATHYLRNTQNAEIDSQHSDVQQGIILDASPRKIDGSKLSCIASR